MKWAVEPWCYKNRSGKRPGSPRTTNFLIPLLISVTLHIDLDVSFAGGPCLSCTERNRSVSGPDKTLFSRYHRLRLAQFGQKCIKVCGHYILEVLRSVPFVGSTGR